MISLEPRYLSKRAFVDSLRFLCGRMLLNFLKGLFLAPLSFFDGIVLVFPDKPCVHASMLVPF